MKGWISSPYFSLDELEVKGMIRVAPGGGEEAIIEPLVRFFLPEKVEGRLRQFVSLHSRSGSVASECLLFF